MTNRALTVSLLAGVALIGLCLLVGGDINPDDRALLGTVIGVVLLGSVIGNITG